MAEKLNFALPPKKKKAGPVAIITLVVAAAALCAGIFNVVIYLGSRDGAAMQSAAAVSRQQAENLALKLEEQELYKPAVKAWRAYLSAGRYSTEDQAKIYYRIGKLLQTDGEYEEALEAFYLSEAIFPVDTIADDIDRRVQKSLERLGKFAFLRKELDDRTSIDTDEQAVENGKSNIVVVAEIGRVKLTEEDLDRMIEERIELQLSSYQGVIDEGELNKQKEALFSRYASSEMRKNLLESFIAEEVLSMKAREIDLAQDPIVARRIEDVERSVLAQSLLLKEFSDQIKLTDSDLENYYRANLIKYLQPERAKISHILLSGTNQAEDVLRRIQSGADFGALAAEYSIDKSTAGAGGKVSEWIDKNGSIPGIGYDREALSLIFSTEAGTVCRRIVSSSQGVHIFRVDEREEEKQKALDEVREDVYRELRTQKETEVQQNLLSRLKQEYDVVIKLSAQSGNEEL
jgi:parvulin-like peptidyl-prolyl isomerase